MKNSVRLLLLLGVALGAALPCFAQQRMFTLLSGKETGIDFANSSPWEFIEGGGVAIGDINNDGLPDIFFGGTEVPDQLYLNMGNMQFKNISEGLGVGGSKFSTGITMADVNNDGWLDIYVCKLKGQNVLYMNNGDLTFSLRAAYYGINHNGRSMQSVFFDYDKDGRLDLFIACRNQDGINATLKTAGMQRPQSDRYSHRLFRQDEKGFFQDVTRSAGILNDTIGVSIAYSVAVLDANSDGWDDLYITNDFDSPDLLYINNRNGGFTEQARTYLKHTSFYAMGVDVADMNNDGLTDIFVADMRPEGNERQKTSAWETPFDWDQLVNNPLSLANKQYVRNTLQLNTGCGTFSDIGEMAGIDATDWSWSPLLADFDNDGHKDIFITNGNFRDVTMNANYPLLFDSLISLHGSGRTRVNPLVIQRQVADLLPQPVFYSYLYKNNGQLAFSNVAQAWGIDSAAITNGAAYADLDNDGDIDLVLNNNNRPASIYRNNARALLGNTFLRVVLHGDSLPPFGTRVTVWCKGTLQTQEYWATRGFYSCSETVLHFGLGSETVVDSLLVVWPDGTTERQRSIQANRTLALHRRTATKPVPQASAQTALFSALYNAGLAWQHRENEHTDFTNEPLLPHQFSYNGPGIAVADVNGDKLDDVFIGGTSAQPGVLLVQSATGTFAPVPEQPWQHYAQADEMGCALFDADGDGDNDLLITHGGNEFPHGSAEYQPQLYLNDGKGNFALATNALPELHTSSSCIAIADANGDGLNDIFIGGRLQAQQYPNTPRSYLLYNTGKGQFKDVTASAAPDLLQLGMVSCALWSDTDNDGTPDLLLAGEWMPITVLHNNGGTLANTTPQVLAQNSTGWWNSITGGDFDNDGDIDYVLGNLGLNTRFHASPNAPVRLFAADIDNNTSTDLIMTFSEDGKDYPVKQLKTLAARINGLAKKYYRPAEFGKATAQDIIPPQKLDSATHLAIVETANCYLENTGNGTFALRRLPIEAQIAPVYGILADDFTDDGNLDILLVGNFYTAEVERGQYDAGTGLLLVGNGSGGFAPSPSHTSGFFVDGNAKALVALLRADSTQIVLAAQNNDSLRCFTTPKPQRFATPLPTENTVEIVLRNGKKRKHEFYTGSGYLSQSGKHTRMGTTVRELRFIAPKGKRRVVK